LNAEIGGDQRARFAFRVPGRRFVRCSRMLMFPIRPVEGPTDIAALRSLFEEYVESLGFHLDFQRFGEELEALPGDYSAPGGCALLAEAGGRIVGCVAMRPLGEGVCEMKRLYVRPDARGAEIGRALALEILRRARLAGYGTIRLDTIDTMKPAMSLYRSLGFREIAPYRHNPIEGAVYFELQLGEDDSGSSTGEERGA
jgi:putative acetyltransferase